MLFNSYEFLFLFLPIVLVVYWGLTVRNRRARLLWLTLASYYFYAFWNWKFLALIIASTAIDYFVGPRIFAAPRESRARRAWLFVSLLSNLGGLAFFKYYNFAADSINGLGAFVGAGSLAPVLNVALPIGISFTAFESLSYTIDLYRGTTKPAKDFLALACFVSVFPRMIAGPIIRYSPFAPQLERDPRTRDHFADAVTGIYFFVMGLAKKVIIADQIAAVINPQLFGDQYMQLGLLGSWGVMLGYTYQLFFDFSGYSDMAVGLGKLLGFDLPQNFNSPYKSTSISDFWRRWHISLSSWLRDYLYIPLGGSRGSQFATLRNLAITMVLGGLWHGASWTYVVWGAYQGFWLILDHLAQGRRLFLPWTWASRAAAFVVVIFGWVLFRCETFDKALYLMQSMVGLHGVDLASVLRTFPVSYWLIVLFCFLITNFAPNTWQIRPLPRKRLAFALGVVMMVCILFLGQRSPFLYFQF